MNEFYEIEDGLAYTCRETSREDETITYLRTSYNSPTIDHKWWPLNRPEKNVSFDDHADKARFPHSREAMLMQLAIDWEIVRLEAEGEVEDATTRMNTAEDTLINVQKRLKVKNDGELSMQEK